MIIGKLYQEKLTSLLKLKYQILPDASVELGDVSKIMETFTLLQKYLYENVAA